MDGFKRAPHTSLIEEAIQAKGSGYVESSAQTFRTDALAILESLVVDIDDAAVVSALQKQGFRSSGSYLTTLHALAEVARSRRPPTAARPQQSRGARVLQRAAAGELNVRRLGFSFALIRR